MLKRNWALIALVYLSLAEALSLAPVPDLALCLIQAEHGQQAADHDDKKYCPSLHVAATLAIEKIDVFLERHDKSVLGGFTIVLAISTIGLWLATNKLWVAGERQFGLLAETSAAQSCDMQDSIANARRANQISADSLGNARETSQTQLRAWIVTKVTHCKLFPPDFEIRVGLEVRNSGQTPAINVRSVSGSVIVPIYPLHGTINCAPPDVVISSRTIIAPSDRIVITIYLPPRGFGFPPISDATVHKWLAAGVAPHLFGWINYEDVFGRTWDTKYCLSVHPQHILDAIKNGTREVSLGGIATSNQWNEIT
jgi:hypothetical protein